MQHQFLMYRYTSHLHTCSRIVQGSDSMTQFPPWRAGHLMMRPYVDPLMNLLEGDSSWIHGTTGRDIKKTTRVKKSQKSANKKRLRWVYIYIYKWVIKETYNIRNNIYIYDTIIYHINQWFTTNRVFYLPTGAGFCSMNNFPFFAIEVVAKITFGAWEADVISLSRD